MNQVIFAMRRCFFALLLLLATTGAARAACTSIAVRSPLPFGVYTGVALSSTTTITVRCSKGFAYEIALGRGNGGSASARMMESGANGLRYGLYQDAARATSWGDDGGVDTVGGTGTGADQTYTVYGLLAGGQRVAPGR
jgi:spore coat protein U-like protein